MPARNFCDICDKEIHKNDAIYGVHINTPESYHQNVLQMKGRIPIAYDGYMICRSCVTNIRGHIEEMKESALQERETKETSMGEKAENS